MLPATYRHWQNSARRLLEPLAALMRPGHADLAIQGVASDHDRQADRLESFARPLTLAAFWLHSAPHPDDTALVHALEELAFFSKELTVLGVYPAHAYRETFSEETD